MQEIHQWEERLGGWGRHFYDLQLLYSIDRQPGFIIFSENENMVVMACATNFQGYPVMILPTSFDVLDAAIIEHLSEDELLVIREAVVPCRIVYMVQDRLLRENFGSLVLRKLSDSLTEIRIDTQMTNEENVIDIGPKETEMCVQARNPQNVIRPHPLFKKLLFQVLGERAYLAKLESDLLVPAQKLLSVADEPTRSVRSKVGRPRNTDDDWAWEQVNLRKQAPKSVFMEWQRRNKQNSRSLVDEERSFRHAIALGRLQRSKRKEPE